MAREGRKKWSFENPQNQPQKEKKLKNSQKTKGKQKTSTL
jgi:hypothetical protein